MERRARPATSDNTYSPTTIDHFVQLALKPTVYPSEELVALLFYPFASLQAVGVNTVLAHVQSFLLLFNRYSQPHR